jgi:hypothetical protein
VAEGLHPVSRAAGGYITRENPGAVAAPWEAGRYASQHIATLRRSNSRAGNATFLEAAVQLNVIHDGGNPRYPLYGVLGAILLTEVARVSGQRYDTVLHVDQHVALVHLRMAAQLGFNGELHDVVRLHSLHGH